MGPSAFPAAAVPPAAFEQGPPALEGERSLPDRSVSPAAASPQGPNAVDAEAIQEVLADLNELGALDPAARDRLMEDLRQTDPALWPLLVRQFRAALAFRRQLEERETGLADKADSGAERVAERPQFEAADAGAAREPPAISAPDRREPSTSVASLPEASDPAGPVPLPPTAPAAGTQPRTAGSDPVAAHASLSQPPLAPKPPPPPSLAAGDSGPPPAGAMVTLLAPEPVDEATSSGPWPADGSEAPLPPGGYRPAEGEVRYAAAHRPAVASVADDWRAHAVAAVEIIEAGVASSPQTEAEVAEHARLRMLYLVAGRRDHALLPIPAVGTSMQQFWMEQLYGLDVLLDGSQTADPARRAAQAREHLVRATASLGESAELIVRNLTFCREILTYGSIEPFDRYEFAPGQNLVLYAEVENYRSEPTPRGYHTALGSSYQIFDSRGARIADHEYPRTEDYCTTPRRDFFIGYQLRIPARAAPGKHVLQLTIADAKSQKIGQASIEFTVVAAAE